MPAYFGIKIEFDKETLHSHYVADFFSMLERNGVRWIGGARDSEGLCRKDAARINQSELEGKLPQKKGEPKHYQNYFSSNGFSEVRAYWTPFTKTMEFELIIPEDVFVFFEQYSQETVWEKVISVPTPRSSTGCTTTPPRSSMR